MSHNSSGAVVGNISIWNLFVAPFSRVALDASRCNSVSNGKVDYSMSLAVQIPAKAALSRVRAFDLSERFALVSLVVLISVALVTGNWVARFIEQSVIQYSAAASAVFMDSFVAPHAQELRTKDRLPVKDADAIMALVTGTELGKQIASIKLWKPGGLIAFSSFDVYTGKTFPLSEKLLSSFAGSVSADFDSLGGKENEFERRIGISMLEIYSPVRDQKTGEIIAVAEFYVKADDLKAKLYSAKLNSWLLVSGLTIFVYITLFSLVRGGSRTIVRQQKDLENQVRERTILWKRLQKSNQKFSEINENFLRRIGSDLHDGPAQLLGLALLKLDSIRPAKSRKANKDDLENFLEMEAALTDAMSEIRSLSSGLVLPELDGMTLTNILMKAVRAHERRTGMNVETEFQALPKEVGNSFGICLYRFVQESLNNVFLHAEASTVLVTAECTGNVLRLTVQDNGVGFDASESCELSERLGIIGMRERIGCIGGKFEVTSTSDAGTTVSCELFLNESGKNYG